MGTFWIWATCRSMILSIYQLLYIRNSNVSSLQYMQMNSYQIQEMYFSLVSSYVCCFKCTFMHVWGVSGWQLQFCIDTLYNSNLRYLTVMWIYFWPICNIGNLVGEAAEVEYCFSHFVALFGLKGVNQADRGNENTYFLNKMMMEMSICLAVNITVSYVINQTNYACCDYQIILECIRILFTMLAPILSLLP